MKISQLIKLLSKLDQNSEIEVRISKYSKPKKIECVILEDKSVIIQAS
jgi:ribosome-associated translation inhibitor RaiA